MILKSIDKRIRQAFSDSALHYDILTSLHKEIGRELLTKVREIEPCERVLDIGMGTGWMTNRLANIFAESKVIGIDFAEGMVHYARGEYDTFAGIQADAIHLPFKDKTFDLIVSNLAFQWIDDLPLALEGCHAKLKDKGTLCATLFGRNTLHELFETLQKVWAKPGQTKELHIKQLVTQEQIATALKEAGFQNLHVDYERIKVRFPDMMGLIKWTKDIGANHLERNAFIGKELLNAANNYYNTHYKDHLGIYATFEVVWIFGKK